MTHRDSHRDTPQAALFADDAVPSTRRSLPVIGEQKDIRYYGTPARAILNGPETTGMGFWSINPYVGCAFGCAYCYARYAHRYRVERSVSSGEAGDAVREDVGSFPPWLAFERRVMVKENAPRLLRETLQRGLARHQPLVAGRETVVVGTATDPYQPAERRFRLTRGILEVLSEHPRVRICIITKSPLITRDVDVLGRLAGRAAAGGGSLTVHVSLITLDRELARRVEPRAPTPESRLRAVRRLREAGVDVGINVMPVLPGITDDPRGIEALVRAVADAGATHLGACALRLRGSARQRYLPFIEQEFPHLAARYRGAYVGGHQVGERYRAGLRRFFERACRRAGIHFGYPDREGDGDDVPFPAALSGQLELGLDAEVPREVVPLADVARRRRGNVGRDEDDDPRDDAARFDSRRAPASHGAREGVFGADEEALRV